MKLEYLQVNHRSCPRIMLSEVKILGWLNYEEFPCCSAKAQYISVQTIADIRKNG